MRDKIIIGLTEKITVFGRNDKKKEVIAKVDTGATKSSIDAKLAAELQLGPVLETKLVKSAQGHALRPVVKAKINLHGKVIQKDITIADRSHMRFRVLIGQNMLTEGFLIDPSRRK